MRKDNYKLFMLLSQISEKTASRAATFVGLFPPTWHGHIHRPPGIFTVVFVCSLLLIFRPLHFSTTRATLCVCPKTATEIRTRTRLAKFSYFRICQGPAHSRLPSRVLFQIRRFSRVYSIHPTTSVFRSVFAACALDFSCYSFMRQSQFLNVITFFF